MNTFVRNLRCFTLLYDKMYTKMYTTLLEQGMVLLLPGLTPAIGTKGFSQDARGLFSALELSLQNTIYLLK